MHALAFKILNLLFDAEALEVRIFTSDKIKAIAECVQPLRF